VIARFDIDGFRIDTLRYLKNGLPLLFGNAIREFALSIGRRTSSLSAKSLWVTPKKKSPVHRPHHHGRHGHGGRRCGS